MLALYFLMIYLFITANNQKNTVLKYKNRIKLHWKKIALSIFCVFDDSQGDMLSWNST